MKWHKIKLRLNNYYLIVDKLRQTEDLLNHTLRYSDLKFLVDTYCIFTNNIPSSYEIIENSVIHEGYFGRLFKIIKIFK